MSSPVPVNKSTLVYLGRTNEWDWRVDYVPTAVESMSSPFRSYDTHRYAFFHWFDFEEQKKDLYVSISNTGTMPILLTAINFLYAYPDINGDMRFYRENLHNYIERPFVLISPQDHKYLHNTVDPKEFKYTYPSARYLMPGMTSVFLLFFFDLASCVSIEAEGFPRRVFMLPQPSLMV